MRRRSGLPPIGFDVDYCNDLAKVLGVTAEIVETPLPDRIPALVSGRIDVGVASTSDTLERAKTAGFTIPYFPFEMVILTKEGADPHRVLTTMIPGSKPACQPPSLAIGAS